MKSFKEFLSEGNPLGAYLKNKNKGLHSIIISPERQTHTAAKNNASHAAMEDEIKKSGHGYRKTTGMYKGHDGEEGLERSFHITAKKPGLHAAARLRLFGRALGKKYGQQSILHVDPRGGGSGTGIQTQASSENKIGKREKYGEFSHYNTKNEYGDTRYKRSHPESHQPKLTFSNEPPKPKQGGKFKW